MSNLNKTFFAIFFPIAILLLCFTFFSIFLIDLAIVSTIITAVVAVFFYIFILVEWD